MAKKHRVPELWIGTSGWTYDDWNGVFYPPDVKASARLDFYVQQFNAVELNATFYRYPTANMITSWNRRMPETFHLAVKASRRITHLKRLRDCAAELTEFAVRISELRPLRVILWQLPPSMRPDLTLLSAFLEGLSRSILSGVRHALEFRHKEWWNDEVRELLCKYRVAFVAVSHPSLPSQIVPTTDFLYIRFHGLGRQLYRYDYSEAELHDWAKRVAEVCCVADVSNVYTFFNNDFHAYAVKNAQVFRELLKGELRPAR